VNFKLLLPGRTIQFLELDEMSLLLKAKPGDLKMAAE
jgi:hypothetical protein